MDKTIIFSYGEYEVLCKVLKHTYTAESSAFEDGADMFYFRELKTHILNEYYRFLEIYGEKRMPKKIFFSYGEYEVLRKVLQNTYVSHPALEDGVDIYYFRELKTHILKENFRFHDTDDE